MSRWHLQPRAVQLGFFSPTSVILIILALMIYSPVGTPRSESGPSHAGIQASPSVSTGGTEELAYAGQTSLGPPGDTPSDLVYDNLTGEMFMIDDPAYLTVLSGTPASIVDSVFLGTNAHPVSVAVDSANDTVFVGLWSSALVVVSGSTHEIIARLTLDVVPLFLAYDPANGVVYTGGGDQYLTAINGTTYAVSAFGPAGDSEFSPFAFAYDPVTGNLVMMGQENCLCGWLSGEVLALDPTTGNQTWMNSLENYDDYYGMAIDNSNGSIYLTTSYGGLKLLNGTSGATLAEFGMPGETGCGLFTPAAMVYNPNSTIVLVGECGGIVRSVNTTSDTVGPPVSVGGMPSSIAVDTDTGNTFVLNWDNNSLAVLNVNCSQVLSYLHVGGAPTAIAIDYATGTAYVASSENVSVINLTSRQWVGSVPADIDSYFEASPEAIVLDPASDEVFVANSGNSTVGVISTLTNTLVATIPVASAPLALAWDYESNEIYAACQGLAPSVSGDATLDVISVATGQVVANSSLGAIIPDGIAYVAPLAELFVSTNALNDSPYFGSPTLTVVSTATNESVGTIALPANATTAGEVVYDNSTRSLYVAGAGMGYYTDNPADLVVNPFTRTVVGNISAGIDPNAIAAEPNSVYVLTASGVNDTVSYVDATTAEAIASVTLPAGTFPQAVAFSPSSGQVLVADWSNDSVSYLLSSEEFPVAFFEAGLPNETSWSVTLNGSTNVSATNTVAFSEPNGTYPFAVGGIVGYSITTSKGNVTVDGSGDTVAVLFTSIPPETYSVDFTESGLAPGTRWSVDFNNTTQQSGGSAVIFGEIPNGTYSFTVIPVSNYNVTPGTGLVTVAGANAGRDIVFTEIHVPLVASINWTTVSGTGICGGGPFSVTVQFFGNATGGNSPYTFTWNFSDNASTSTSQNPRYTYTTGPYVAGLTVTDSRGATTTKSVTLLFESSCPSSMATFGDALSVITLVVSLILAVSVGAFAHRVTRVKPRVR
jgi:YVTN family beta-propeller protein